MDLLDLFIDLRGSTMFQAQREIKFAGNQCYEVYTVVMLELLDQFRRTARIDRRENLGREFSVGFQVFSLESTSFPTVPLIT